MSLEKYPYKAIKGGPLRLAVLVSSSVYLAGLVLGTLMQALAMEEYMENFWTIFAAIIAVLSLFVAIYVTWKDNGRLRVIATPIRHSYSEEYSYIRVQVVNVGRRNVGIKFIVGHYLDGTTSRFYMNQQCEPILLSEGADYLYKLGKFDGPMAKFEDEDCDNDTELKTLAFEDTTGKVWKAKGSKDAIAQVRLSKHPFGVRTHY